MRNDGATIGGVHTSEYGLVMTGYEITYPEPDRIQRDIPYGPTLDFTEALLEDVPYKRRKLTMTFDLVGNYLDFETALLALSNAVHGQWLQVILDSDPAYYYQGAITVERTKDNPVDGDVVITCDANPYKLERFPSDGTWEWDPFRFDTGIIRNYVDLPVQVVVSSTDRNNFLYGDANPYKLERFPSDGTWEWDPFRFDTGIIRNYVDLPVQVVVSSTDRNNFLYGDVSKATKLVIPGCRQKVAPRFQFAADSFSDSNASNGLMVLLFGPGEGLDGKKLYQVVKVTAATNWSPDLMIGSGDHTLYLLGFDYQQSQKTILVSVDYQGGML